MNLLLSVFALSHWTRLLPALLLICSVLAAPVPRSTDFQRDSHNVQLLDWLAEAGIKQFRDQQPSLIDTLDALQPRDFRSKLNFFKTAIVPAKPSLDTVHHLSSGKTAAYKPNKLKKPRPPPPPPPHPEIHHSSTHHSATQHPTTHHSATHHSTTPPPQEAKKSSSWNLPWSKKPKTPPPVQEPFKLQVHVTTETRTYEDPIPVHHETVSAPKPRPNMGKSQFTGAPQGFLDSRRNANP